MTRAQPPPPKRKPTTVKTAVDPVVQAMFDQVHELEREEVVSPFAKPEATGVFAGSVFAKAAPTGVFAKAVERARGVFAPRATGVFAPKARGVFLPEARGVFGPSGPGKLTVRRFIVPPPVGPPEPVHYWLSFCEVLNLFPTDGKARNRMWNRGESIDFEKASFQLGYKCIEEGENYDDPDHDMDEDGCCRSEMHYLSANPIDTLEETLGWCGCETIAEFEQEWNEILPNMMEIREFALRFPEKALAVVGNPDSIYRVAGWTMDDLYQNLKRGHEKRAILDAVAAGPHDSGLAAAFADAMARYYARAFGSVGDAVDKVVTAMHEEEELPRYPQPNLVFESIREPIRFWNGSRYPTLDGLYGITRAEYHSGLVASRVDRLPYGTVGWRSLWLRPVDKWCEILEEDGITVLGDDEDDDDPGYDGSAC